MQLKLIDIEADSHEAEFGTCELCFSTGWVEEPVFIFQKEDGEQVKIDAYYWDWGDYNQLYVDNIVEFATFIATREYAEDTEFEYTWLDNEIWDYEELKENTIE